MSLYAELKRRNVLRVATAYVAVSWLVIQVLETLLPIFGSSETAARTVVVILGIGLIPVLILAWVFELTPDGLRRDGQVDHSTKSSRDSAKTLDRVIIGVLSVAVIYFAIDKFILDPARDIEIAAEATEQARDNALLSSYGENSIAVMPFADMSADKDQEYFSDGVAEEIINLLSRIRNLRVIARSSAFSFKGQSLAASEIASRLNVRYVMEGSIRRAGNRLRITTTMIDAGTDTQLWSENFDRDFGDIFAIQDEIAGKVVDRLEMQISGNLPHADRVDPESYALYLQARHLRKTQNADATAEADRVLQQALAIDPNNIAALLFIHPVSESKEYWGLITREEAISAATEATNRVLLLDPENPEALVTLRQLSKPALDTWQGELEAASFGLRMLPYDVHSNTQAASSLSILGFQERSLEYLDFVIGQDPLCVGCRRIRTFALIQIGDFEGATEATNKYRTLTGGSGTYTLGIIQLLQGDAEAALETIAISNTFQFVMLQGEAIANWSLGRMDEYEAALAELEASLLNEEYKKFRVRPADFLAGVYAWVGRSDDAFEILEELIDPPESWGATRWMTDPVFRNLHDDPRWMALREKEGAAPWQIESYDMERLFPGPGIVPAD